MSDRKLAQKLQPLLKQVWKLSRRLTKAMVNWLLRTVFLLNRRPRVAGFVLPTTVFLILVVSLTVGALTFRSFNSTTRTIGNVQSRQIYNAATPAIDRARAKLDYLFAKDNRLPSGVPAEEIVISMLLNDGRPIGPAANAVSSPAKADDPYTFGNDTEDTSKETRIDINGDGQLDNAWIYKDNNTNSSVIYSITLSTPDVVAGDTLGPLKLLQLTDKQKADGNTDGPFARTGPLSNSEAVSCRVAGGGSTVEGGWYQDQTNTSILRKRFQVDAFVVSNDTVNKGRPTNFTTLEFAQDRKLDRGNKWGAWFKYDLEVTPGAKLNWNGAMHSEGSILIGRNVSPNSGFTGYLISSPSSCLFRPASNSEMSSRKFDEQNGDVNKKFFGIIGAGDIRSNDFSGSSEIHTYNGSTYQVPGNFTSANDWKVDGGKGTLDAITTDPKALLTQDIQQAVAPALSNADDRISETAIANNPYGQQERFFVTETNTQPYVDDTYRADNRYGPKVRYKNESIPAGTFVGADIPIANTILTGGDGTGGKEVGLDGYWERRTFKDADTSSSKIYTGGMRILVGERLEMGNPYGWVPPQNKPDAAPATLLSTKSAYSEGVNGEVGDVSNLKTSTYAVTTNIATVDASKSDVEGDPLYPPYAYTGTANTDHQHEAKQRRALRDNPAAVQAAAIYHYRLGETADGRTPAACLALTAHPGSPYTLRQSVNFKPYSFNGGAETLYTDFFYGKGTNGWEFEPPAVAQLQGGALRQALLNLANFAGDPDGAFPPKQEAGKVHPDPFLTMWGNFSNLRRALIAGNTSPADQSYLQTAGCTMGMLAYNINQVQKFDPSAASNQIALTKLGKTLFGLMDGKGGFETNSEVLPQAQLSTYPSGTLELAKYNARDYDRVTPDIFLATLLNKIRAEGTSTDPENDPQYQLARLIHEHFQIRRDRTYGFRPSPAANTWNYNPYTLQMPIGITEGSIGLWSSACDPNIFKVSSTPAGSNAASAPSLSVAGVGDVANEARYRLALSRLCGEVIPAGNLQDLKTSLGDNNYPALGDPTNSTNLPAPNQTYYKTLPTGETVNADFATVALQTEANINNDLKRATVAPKFPSLYYIFPEETHDHLGDLPVGGKDYRQPGNPKLYTGGAALPIAYQPWKEPYITQVASGASYEPVSATQAVPVDTAYSIDYTTIPTKLPTGAANPDAIETFTYSPSLFPVEDKSVAAAALQPRAAITDWVLPTTATTNNPNHVIAPDGTVAVVPLQDKVAFNGREWLPSRVLDVDLDMLRTTAIGDDTWLPASGIVYAFREDAVREDNIARPANALGYTNAQTPGAGNETDPLKDATFGVSVKAVDFIPDPDRRPHGFRLRNGAILKREGTIPAADNFRGVSFITDQPAYIMGNFNLHQATAGGARLEEFTEQLPNDPTLYSTTTFYDNRKTRDTNFANPTKDLWRPSEVLADTVIMLSDQFCDGSAIDTFMTAGSATPGSRLGIGNTTSSGSPAADIQKAYSDGVGGASQGGAIYNDTAKALFASGCVNDATNGATSFLNQNRPGQPLSGTWNWVRENPGNAYSPVKISRNGNGLIANSSTGVPIEYSSANDTAINGTYFKIDDTNNRARALQDRGTETTTMNAILISNIIPSRANQQNGALNNFPRFLEDWKDSQATLRFAGSFLQLGFSNYATAPFDQDRWEPSGATVTSGTNEYTSFFRPPARLWGYDVALQLAQASPAANRFTTPSSEKNEFYTEPAANDPYMQNLCGALKANAPAGLDAGKLNCPT